MVSAGPWPGPRRHQGRDPGTTVGTKRVGFWYHVPDTMSLSMIERVSTKPRQLGGALLAGFVLATAVASCGGGNPTDPGVGPGPEFDLVIMLFGSVTDLAGEPLGQVTIEATTFRRQGACDDQPVGLPQSTTTDEDGTYRLTITLEGEDEFEACVTVDALPPAGSELQPVSHIRQVRARLRDERIDPLRVDITLTP